MSDQPFPTIETARLRLACVTAGDAEPMAALMSLEISRWLASWSYPTTPDMMRVRIDTVRHAACEGRCMPCVMVRRSDDTILGWVFLTTEAARPGRGSLGYWIGEDFQGQGFMREAVSALIQAGFERLDLDVIEAGAQTDNVGSFAVMRACGMTKAGERMVHASARDREEACLFYEIRRSAITRSAT